MGRKCPIISHLMFPYDLLLFGKAVTKQMACVRNVLSKFYNISGQMVRNGKTKVLFSKKYSNSCEKRDSLYVWLEGD